MQQTWPIFRHTVPQKNITTAEVV